MSQSHAVAACSYCGLPVTPSEAGIEARVWCCFGCRFAEAITRERDDVSGSRTTLTRLGLGVFFTMNVMVFTIALWSTDVYGTDSGTLPRALHEVFRYLCLLFSLPVVALLGGPLLSHAIEALRARRLATELLIVAGVFAAFVYSCVSVLRGQGHVYFEVACMVLVLVTLGRWLEATGRHRSTAALDELEELLPSQVTRVSASQTHTIELAEVKRGDQLRVRAGERIPVDGEVVAGSTTVDEQVFTGESVPRERGCGDEVVAGTLNLDGVIDVKAGCTPHEGAMARLRGALQTARLTRGHYQRLADRAAQWFVPGVAGVAVCVFGWHLSDSLSTAVLSSLSVVLIACPCALGLATPLAVWTTFNRAALGQILFRNGEALEKLASVRAIRFDKTGTLTSGTPAVQQVFFDADTERSAAIAVASLLAASSTHVFSRAVCRSLDQDLAGSARDAPDICGIRTHAGHGVSATLIQGDATTTALLGHARFVGAEDGAVVPPRIREGLDLAARSGAATVLVAWDHRVRMLFLLEEELRPYAVESVTACRDLGLSAAVLSGDRVERALRWESRLGIPVHAGLIPEQKVEHVRDAQSEEGLTVMVGDGINDAPALEASDVGVALGCGADVTRDSAGVCIMSDDLRCVPEAIQLARRTRRVIRQNLVWAFGYNSCGIFVAAAGKLNPVIAAALMVVSSVIVIANSLRLAGPAHPDGGQPVTEPPSAAPEGAGGLPLTARGHAGADVVTGGVA